MPALQVSAATIASLINGNQGDISGKNADAGGKKSGTDQFSSILDIVGNFGDSSSKKDDKKDDVKDPVANIITQPASFRDTPKKEINSVNSKDIAKNSDNDNDSRYAENKVSINAKENRKSEDSDASPRAGEDNKTQPKQSINKSDKNDDVSQSSNADDLEESDEVKAKTSKQADDITNLMDIIAQLLAGAGNVNAETPIINEDTADYLQKSSDALAIFANLKDVLAKLKEFLQAANAQNTPLSQQQTDALSQINTALASDLAALKNLFPQGLGADDRQSLFSRILQQSQAVNASDNLAQIEDPAPLLEKDISIIRELLQKFRDENFAPINKSDGNADKQNSATNVLDTINSNNAGESRKSEAFTLSSVVTTTVTVQSSNQQATQAQNNPNITPVSSLVQKASSNASFDSNSGGNSGQGSNSGSQFAIGGMSQTSAKISENAGSSQFSSLLNRTTQTPVVEQVAFQVKSAFASGNSKITIQLNPEDLGKLDITLDIDSKGKTGVTITADNKQTLDLLQRDSQALQKALSDAGLKADSGSLSFNLRGGEREGQGQNQNESHAASKYQKSQPEELQSEELNIASIATVTRNYIINIPDGLNIKI